MGQPDHVGFADNLSKTRSCSDKPASETTWILDHLTVPISITLLPITALVLYIDSQHSWDIGLALRLTAFAIIGGLIVLKIPVPSGLRVLAAIALFTSVMLIEIWHLGPFSTTLPFLAIVPILVAAIRGLRWGVGILVAIIAAFVTTAWPSIGMQQSPQSPMSLLSTLDRTETGSIFLIHIVIAVGASVYILGSLYWLHSSERKALCQHKTEMTQLLQTDVFSKQVSCAAHDLNNQLAIILGDLEILNEGMKNDKDKERVLNSIEAVIRSSKLTKKMIRMAELR